MKYFLIVLVLLILLVSCSENPSSQDTSSQILTDSDVNSVLSDESSDSIEVLDSVSDEEFVVEESSDAPGTDIAVDSANELDDVTLDFDVNLAGIKVTKDTYAEDEEQELRFSLDSPVSFASLSFDLVCDEDVDDVVLSINDVFVSRYHLDCGKRVTLPLSPELFIDGFNIVLLQMHVNDDTYGDDVNLSFVTDAKNFSWAGKRLSFETVDEDDQEEVVLGSLENVRFRAVERRTFKVNKDKLSGPLTMSFLGDRRDGKVQVLLNEEEIFSGEINEKENIISLPLDTLSNGKNELVFVLLG